MSETTWRTVAYRNAQRLFKLPIDLDAEFDSLPFVVRPGLPHPPIEKIW